MLRDITRRPNGRKFSSPTHRSRRGRPWSGSHGNGRYAPRHGSQRSYPVHRRPRSAGRCVQACSLGQRSHGDRRNTFIRLERSGAHDGCMPRTTFTPCPYWTVSTPPSPSAIGQRWVLVTHEQATFSDPVFPDLDAEQAAAMWKMLLTSGSACAARRKRLSMYWRRPPLAAGSIGKRGTRSVGRNGLYTTSSRRTSRNESDRVMMHKDHFAKLALVASGCTWHTAGCFSGNGRRWCGTR